VGWIVAARPLVAALTEAKQWADLHTDQLSQAVMLRFASSGALEAHLRNAKETGGQRLRACLEACERHLPEGTRFTRPEGGMSLWVTLPDGIDASQLLVRAESEGVEYLPGPVFGVGRTHASSLRLSYSGLAPAAIERGLRILARCAMEARERVRQTNPAPALV
jgi:2-aminoadipate transaminase